MAGSVSRNPSIHQLKVSVRDIRPQIWRRLQVRSTGSLSALHRAVQAVMGWWDYHLHVFVIDGVEYGDPTIIEEFEGEDERWKRLHSLAPLAKTHFAYNYDFGDDWWLDLLVEQVLPPDPAVRYPVCLDGRRASPPEDVGGVFGYQEFLKAIRNPRHLDHEQMVTWIGGAFDPKAFDVAAANARLHRRR